MKKSVKKSFSKKKTFKNMKLKMLKGKTKKHKKTLNKRKKLQIGGTKLEEFISNLNTEIVPTIFNPIKGDSTDAILESLKITINPEILENMVKEVIDKTNTGKTQSLIPKKLPCAYVRKLYKNLINLYKSLYTK